MSRLIAFTPEVLFRLFEQYNAATWPLPPLAYGLALLAVALAWKPRLVGDRGSDRVVAAILAGFWIWTGIVFHGLYFTGINFIAPVYALLFVAQGLLLAWTGVVRGRLQFRLTPAPRGRFGLGFVAFALVAYPLIGFMAGHGGMAMQHVGVAPGPTVVFTLGMLLLGQRRVPLRSLAVPLLWSVIAGAAAWPLAMPEDLSLPLAAAAGLGLAIRINRRITSGGGG